MWDRHLVGLGWRPRLLDNLSMGIFKINKVASRVASCSEHGSGMQDIFMLYIYEIDSPDRFNSCSSLHTVAYWLQR